MPKVVSVCRLAFSAALALNLSLACGGQSFNGNGNEGGTGGNGTTGGKNGTSGSSSTGGKSASGGSASGGSQSAGGTNSGAGTTSTGGTPPVGEACTAPPVTGSCEAAFPHWYHDPQTGVCMPFTYGGCGGNENNYDSLEACQAACRGNVPNYDACKVPGDCIVTGTGCCGVCDSPNLTKHDFIAYNKANAKEVLDCTALDIACAPCPPTVGDREYFVRNCVQGECVVEDLRSSDVTSCESSADCRLRIGTGCCEGCGGGIPIAVRNDGSFEKLVCGDSPQICPACEPVPPQGAIAFCNQGRCDIAYPADDDAN